MEILNKSIATGLNCYQEAVQRLAEVPGFGIDSAHQVIAEVGLAPNRLHRLNRWHPGWEYVQDARNPPRYPKATAVERAGRCGGFSRR